MEALIKKHKNFKKSLATQDEKIRALEKFATKLIEDWHILAHLRFLFRGLVSAEQ